MKLDVCYLIHFRTSQFMVPLSVKGFLSKFKIRSFSYQTRLPFPCIVSGVLSHSEYGHR